jgi:3'-5' exoribonuclease
MANSRRFINQLQPGESLDQVFLVRDRDLRTASNGGLYIVCTLTDRSGKLNARMWQANETIYKAIPIDGFLQVRGRTENYKGNLQFIVEAIRPIPQEKVDLTDFLPCAPRDVEEMWAELLELVRGVKNNHLRMLIKKFVEDHEFVAAFKRAPAAMELHQAYLGGLLEHTLGVTRAAKAILPLYPQLNGDLLLTGAFLHDVGKATELTSDLTFRYTDRGQLVGHITIGAIWIQQKVDMIAAETCEPFPAKTLDLLQHLILSHHGLYEYGSPKLPMIPEAAALHYLDNLDAKIHMFNREITGDPDTTATFTGFHRALEVRIYKGSGSLEDGAGPVAGGK